MTITVTSNKQRRDSRGALGPFEPMSPGSYSQFACLTIHPLLGMINTMGAYLETPKHAYVIRINSHSLVERYLETQMYNHVIWTNY